MIAPDELRALCQRIINSGELGRSKTYAAILEYLAEQAIEGRSPKEISIAMDVLGRGADFDVGKDSIVRVHIYHLRNKLNAYYAKHGGEEKYRLEIPKGQYILATSLNTGGQDAAGATTVNGRASRRASATPWLAALAVILLALNLYQAGREEQSPAAPNNPYRDSALWAPILADDQPVLVLVGDYFIMGEMNEYGIVSRMVREFDINSSSELDRRQQLSPEQKYINLDLSYLPSSVANALAHVMQVLGADGGRARVKLMSDFTAADLVGNHIIYLGYLSGLQSLQDLMFAGSGLATGVTFDELVNIDTNESYTSSSGLSTGEDTYRDFGLLSTFPAPSGSQYLFLAGMRDEGLINLAQEVTMLPALDTLEQEVIQPGDELAFEALYEVRGFSNTNIDASLIYHKTLDTDVLWEARLLETGLQGR